KLIIHVQRFVNLFRWLNVILIFATFLAYLSPYVNPEDFWQVSLFGLIYPWLLLFNLLFVLFWLVLKKKNFLLSLACIIMGWGHLTSTLGWSSHPTSIPEESLAILSYNVQNFRYVSSGKDTQEKSKRFQEITRWLKSEEVDVFCAQELHRITLNTLDSIAFPYNHSIRRQSASIHSNYPFLDKGRLDFGKSVNAAVWADIEFSPGKVLRIYSIHLQSSGIDPDAIDVVAEGKIQEKQTWFSLKRIIGKFKEASSVRARQAKQVAAHIQKSPHPVVVCGDFNETPLSYVYRIVSQSLQDAFKVRGRGFGTTYAGKIPALRIDYILTDPQIEILEHRIMRRNFSDHYPVKSRIHWRN
ncbi:MAG: endonuclease/exonuclease/phosphatase family protein, partial [Bacteroidota bacterium]